MARMPARRVDEGRPQTRPSGGAVCGRDFARRGFLSLTGIALCWLGYAAWAAEPAALAAQLARSYLAATPAEMASSALTTAEAEAVQAEFVRLLTLALGDPVGYKAALTSQAAQVRFSTDRPVAGVLLERMLLNNGASIGVASGIRLMGEADLLVRVGSTTISSAASRQEILAALSEVIPFIEVPDMVYRPDGKPDGPALTAINAGARHGVLGAPMALAATEEWERRLAEFRVVLRDGAGNVLAEGRGADLLGHPLEVVRWLRDELQRQGRALKPGDLISLGSLTRLIPVGAGMMLRAEYLGLDPASGRVVEARFE